MRREEATLRSDIDSLSHASRFVTLLRNLSDVSILERMRAIICARRKVSQILLSALSLSFLSQSLSLSFLLSENMHLFSELMTLITDVWWRHRA